MSSQQPEERHRIYSAPGHAHVGPLLSALGGTLLVIGFWLPLFVISPPSNSRSPYPTFGVNGWQASQFLLCEGGPDFGFSFVAPWLPLGVLLLSLSLLALFHGASLLAARTCSFAAFASIAALSCFYVSFGLGIFAGSPDAALATPRIAPGLGSWFLLLGTALSAIGAGSASIGALIGAVLGTVIGLVLSVALGSLLIVYTGPSLAFCLLSNAEGILWVGVSMLSSILGGWMLLRRQARRERSTV